VTKSDNRVHWLDGARALLITIGILLLASRIYDTSGSWLVHDASGSPAFEAAWRVIHIFRMPAFFIVAGFFCALSVRRHGADGFLPRRFLRVGVPMLAIALTLNVAQDWLLYANATGRTLIPGYLASERFAAFWRDANWHSHLWFLHYSRRPRAGWRSAPTRAGPSILAFTWRQ
jgi:glucan biosynthesis protein C